MRYRFVFTVGILAICFALSRVSAATWKITYAQPNPDKAVDIKQSYPLQLLALALEQTGVRYELKPTSKSLTEKRSRELLRANREIQIIWRSTTRDLEAEFLPVRIPIYKGLMGLRVLLLDTENAGLLQPVEQLAELRQFIPVQGYNWPDTKVLQANGFEVTTAANLRQMYGMLQSDTANFSPRSIIEVWDEVSSPAFPASLQVEPHLALYYPSATYFFVNRKNLILANLVSSGLERALARGMFDQLFLSVHKELMESAGIDGRTLFELENPELPESTPLHRRELWFRMPSNTIHATMRESEAGEPTNRH